MSVIKAILFYSKYDGKSFRMKQIIDSIGTDLETVCVDPLEIRERLLQDENYCITQVPSVLIIYSSGQHKVLILKPLDRWFEQLIKNIQLEQNQQANIQVTEQEYTPITELTPIVFEESVQEFNVPKELRRKPGNTEDIRPSLASPGREKLYDEQVGQVEQDTTQLLIPGGGSLPITGGQVGQMVASTIVPDTMPKLSRGIKNNDLSPKDLARQMEEQREKFDENIEKNRPKF